MISYLPLWSGITLPSYPLYPLGEQTGQFRFLMLWVLCLHAVVLILWAWSLRVLEVTRWRPSSRWSCSRLRPASSFGAPSPTHGCSACRSSFVGLAMLVRPLPERPGRVGHAVWRAFAAGTLLWVAQSIHYTALYLVVPAGPSSCGAAAAGALAPLLTSARARRFAVGCLWLQGLTEFVDHVVLGLPWEQGPTATLFALRTQHRSLWSAGENLVVWWELFLSQMGPVLLALIGVGWLLLLWRGGGIGRSAPLARRLIALSAPLGLLYPLFAVTAPFFRQTSVLQPFLFLFAGL